MSVEINQPIGLEPPSPDSFDIELDWRKVHQQWLRAVGPQFNLNVSQLVIGQILTCIIDDGNLVTWVNFGFRPADGQAEHRRLIERLVWEIDTPELPKEIRAILEKEKAAVEGLDGSNEVSFRQVSSAYFAARAETINREQKDRKLQAADDYYVGMACFGILDAPYQDFIAQLNP